MKKYYTMAGLALLLVSGAGVAVQETREPRSEETMVSVAMEEQRVGEQTGEELMSSLRLEVQEGRYAAFLAELEGDYQQLVQRGQIEDFIKLRESLPADEQIDQLAKEWEKVHRSLLQERNAELKAACVGVEDPIVTKWVASIANPLPEEQTAALQALSALRFKTPSQAKNDDEKALILIDIASEFKMLHLDAQYAMKPFDLRQEKQIVLKMDELRQMVEASQSFTDKDLQAQVSLAAEGFDAWQSRQWNSDRLNQVVKKPTNELEKTIGSILANYKTKKEDLYQKEFISKLIVQ